MQYKKIETFVHQNTIVVKFLFVETFKILPGLPMIVWNQTFLFS